jgi:hypothetical protein
MSTAGDGSVLTFDVFSVDDETDEETLIGKVGCDHEGRLNVHEVDPEHAVYLNNAVERVNQKDTLAEFAPPQDESPRFTVGSRVVQRTDDDFVATLQAYLLRYYGLSLG